MGFSPSQSFFALNRCESRTSALSPMNRLVCIVEGHGEVEAMPNLCSRIVELLEAWDWFVDPNPIRQPKGRLVDHCHNESQGLGNKEGIQKAMALARARPADAVLVICDSDDDCAARWGPSATSIVGSILLGTAVMIEREYETWLLLGLDPRELECAGIKNPNRKRDAKGALRAVRGSYKPSTDQLRMTREMDIARVWSCSDSFDKLVRSLALVFGVVAPDRPSVEDAKQIHVD